MSRPLPLRAAFILSLALALSASSTSAQTFGAGFVNDYTFSDLGQPAGIPNQLGGINFKPGNLFKLLIGGTVNSPAGAVYEIAVVRDSTGHITAFTGTATQVSTATNINGGLDFEPSSGVLFYTGYSNNILGQIERGSSVPDRIIVLTPLGVASSVGAVTFVPPGFPGAGKMKLAVYNTNTWYDADRTPDGNGTFDVSNVVLRSTLVGGLQGAAYVHGGNAAFTVDSVLVTEWGASRVSAYAVDANGDPIAATRRDFMTGVSSPRGAVIDPMTGDFLFTTFSGGGHVIVVRGFDLPIKYCTASVNSQGCAAQIGYSGTASLSGPDDFKTLVTQTLNRRNGIELWGVIPSATPFAGGTLCIVSPRGRTPVRSTGGSAFPTLDCSGTLSTDWTHAFIQGKGLFPGTSVFVQFVYRDPGFVEPNNLSLSDALRFTITN